MIKTFKEYTSSIIKSEREIVELLGLEYRFNNTGGSIDCKGRTLNNKNLQFHNGEWVYKFSLYWDGKYGEVNFPIVGVLRAENEDMRGFLLNSKEDVMQFGEFMRTEDISNLRGGIKTVSVEEETIQTGTKDYEGAKSILDKMVRGDKTIIDASVGRRNDNITLLRYKK